MADPTYIQGDIEANPEWALAFSLSEIMNDSAPIGWGRYIGTAQCLLANWHITRKGAPSPTLDAATLEACAKVAEERHAKWEVIAQKLDEGSTKIEATAFAWEAEEIAAAIRALSEKEKG